VRSNGKEEQDESGTEAGEQQERTLEDAEVSCAARMELSPGTMGEPRRGVGGESPLP